MKDLGIIVVAGDELPLLKQCLPAAASACRGIEHELVVIDNASRDGASDWVASQFPDAKIVRLDRRARLGAARNAGARESSAEFLLFLDADARLEPGAAGALLDFMRGEKCTGLAGPRMLYPDGRFQESCRSFQTWSSFIRRGLGLQLGARDRGILGRAREAREPFDVDWVIGACHFVRRRAVEEVGPMNERFRLYYCDVEWCRRMKAGGWKVCYVPSAVCVHRYRRRSAGFPPGRWTLVHLMDYLRFRRKRPRLAKSASRGGVSV